MFRRSGILWARARRPNGRLRSWSSTAPAVACGADRPRHPGQVRSHGDWGLRAAAWSSELPR